MGLWGIRVGRDPNPFYAEVNYFKNKYVNKIYLHYSPQTSMDKDIQRIFVSFCHLPGITAVQKNRDDI